MDRGHEKDYSNPIRQGHKGSHSLPYGRGIQNSALHQMLRSLFSLFYFKLSNCIDHCGTTLRNADLFCPWPLPQPLLPIFLKCQRWHFLVSQKQIFFCLTVLSLLSNFYSHRIECFIISASSLVVVHLELLLSQFAPSWLYLLTISHVIGKTSKLHLDKHTCIYLVLQYKSMNVQVVPGDPEGD